MITGTQINLRTVRQRDLAEYLELHSMIATRGDYFPINLLTESRLKSEFEKDGMWSAATGTLIIADKTNDRIIGSISHFSGTHYYHGLEVGYIIFRPDDRGQGYGSEALTLYSNYLFDWLPISRLQVQVEPGNIPSRRIAEKCGYRFEGTSRSAFIAKGAPLDINVFSLVRSDLAE